MELKNVLFVDWEMGTILIGVFAIVCIVLIAVVINMINKTDIVPSDETKKL